MAVLKFSKTVDSLPASLQPDTVYLVKSGASVTMYVTDSTGSTAHQVGAPTQGSAEDSIDPFLLMGVSSA